jgi:dipeptidyl aminopeptidase/acylaminoacyl peptidase
MEDDSQASKPSQTYHLFHALRGQGATARLVLLPHENHRYFARESILHAAAEMIEWFDRHLKPRGLGGSTSLPP